MSSLRIKIKYEFKTMSEKNRLIFNNIIGAFTIKGVALIVSLFTMPAYIRYFDNQQVLGLWFTMLSILSWILTFDLGIGNGLRNKLVPILVEKDYNKAKKYISSAYIGVGVLVLIGIILSLIIFPIINWNIIFNIDENVISRDVLNVASMIVFLGIMFQFLLKLITSILYAMQKSALTNLLSLLNSIIILNYVLFAKTSSVAANLIYLAFIHVLAVNLPLLIASVYIFSNKLKGCCPNLKFFRFRYAKSIMKLGGMFFWVQIMYMILTTTNEFLIIRLVGSEMVVEYQIYNKLFSLIGSFFTLALTPMWSAVTKAIVEEDYLWIKKLFRYLKLLSLVAVVCQFLMIPFLQIGINLWLGDEAIQVNYLYATVFAILGSIFIWNGVISSIANGIGKLKVQTICFTVGAIIKIPLAMLLVNVMNSWIGIIVPNIITMGMYCIIEPIIINNFIKDMEKGENKNV